jgi:glycine reductase
MIGFKAATYLGKAGKNVEPNEVKTFETLPLLQQVAQYPELPKVVYVYMIQTQGLLHDTYVYGVDGKKIIPTIMYPTEAFDGAVVSGNCVSACDKNPTYVHMNHPVIEELYERHGKDINFIGCVVTNENVYLADKQRSSDWVAKTLEYLGADAAVVSEEGFGNPDADLVMNCNKITDKGIKTVLLTDEYAGQDGSSQSLADSTPKADAVVTNGNANEVIVLPKLDKIIGHPEAANVIAGANHESLREDGSIEAEIQVITGATSEVGFHYLTAKGY